MIGVSVGALNAVFLAQGPTLERVGALEAIWHGLDDEAVFAGSRTYRLGRMARRASHVCDPVPLRALIAAHVGVSTSPTCPCPSRS